MQIQISKVENGYIVMSGGSLFNPYGTTCIATTADECVEMVRSIVLGVPMRERVPVAFEEAFEPPPKQVEKQDGAGLQIGVPDLLPTVPSIGRLLLDAKPKAEAKEKPQRKVRRWKRKEGER